MNRKCFKPFAKISPNNANSQNVVSFWETLFPRHPTGALPLNPTGDFRPPDSPYWTPQLTKPAYAFVLIVEPKIYTGHVACCLLVSHSEYADGIDG